MVKRINHIVLSLVLLLGTAGFAISKHYCGDRMIALSVNGNADSCCNNSSCCHDESFFYQLDEDFSVHNGYEIPQIVDLVLFGHDLIDINEIPDKISVKYAWADISPPPKTVQEFLSSIQVFIL